MKELAKALSAVQGTLKAAKKDAENPFFKNKYADLSAVWDVIREPLAKNGLAVVQGVEGTESGWALKTTLLHTSGDSVSSWTPLLMAKQDAQGLGSAMTYARRYALAAIVGVVADEDDDGNAASQPKAAPAAPAKPQSKGITQQTAALILKATVEGRLTEANLNAALKHYRRENVSKLDEAQGLTILNRIAEKEKGNV